ncbi:LuxR C-terminal-related transcriptional regulator [Scandinavium sp.]|uniref:LuxR C-terminal-related transcriptional regulator n=1 Tax=Scandinavium sp. TaxID=2830653 RepID=UPI00289CA342|nr:LuxR C-terminal-related transcriptional regulator [Scandinavium sp.]
MHTERTIHILTNDAWLVEGITLALRENCTDTAVYAAPALQECIASLEAIRNNAGDDDMVVISIDDVALLKAVSAYIEQPELRTIVMLDVSLDSSFIIYGWLCLTSKKATGQQLLQLVHTLGQKSEANPAFITPQEKRVLSGLLQGHSKTSIGAKMHLSVKTISHLKINVARKIGAARSNDVVLLRYMHMFHSSIHTMSTLDA